MSTCYFLSLWNICGICTYLLWSFCITCLLDSIVVTWDSRLGSRSSLCGVLFSWTSPSAGTLCAPPCKDDRICAINVGQWTWTDNRSTWARPHQGTGRSSTFYYCCPPPKNGPQGGIQRIAQPEIEIARFLGWWWIVLTWGQEDVDLDIFQGADCNKFWSLALVEASNTAGCPY